MAAGGEGMGIFYCGEAEGGVGLRWDLEGRTEVVISV